MCRGRGFACFEFRGKKEFDLSQVEFVCEMGSASIPSSWFKLAANSVALTVPLMLKGPLVIKGFYRDRCVYRRAWSWELIKWVSRLNYKVRSNRALFMRDGYSKADSNRILIKPATCLRSSSADEWIVKGIISSPIDVSGDDIYVIGADGTRVVEPDLRLVRSSSVREGDRSRVEMPFTFRFKERPAFSLCIVATGNGACCPGFLCFNEELLQAYSGEYSPLWFSIAG